MQAAIRTEVKAVSPAIVSAKSSEHLKYGGEFCGPPNLSMWLAPQGWRVQKKIRAHLVKPAAVLACIRDHRQQISTLFGTYIVCRF